MKSIIEKAKFCKRVVEYAIKKNNNAKAARRYQTTRQQVKRWRDKYDGTVKSLMYKSKRPKSHPNQHTEQEIELIIRKCKKYGFEGMAEVYVKYKSHYIENTFSELKTSYSKPKIHRIFYLNLINYKKKRIPLCKSILHQNPR